MQVSNLPPQRMVTLCSFETSRVNRLEPAKWTMLTNANGSSYDI